MGSTAGRGVFFAPSRQKQLKLHSDLKCLCTEAAFVSCKRPYSLRLTTASLSCPVLHFIFWSISFALHQSAGRKENIKASNFDAASVATCTTGRQTLCCLGVDINWPFQSLPNSRVLAAPLLVLFYSEAAENNPHPACRPKQLEQRGWNELIFVTSFSYCYLDSLNSLTRCCACFY